MLPNGPHRRRNALTGDSILVSPQRTQRPWQGHQEAVAADRRPPYDPKCYLCPGNERMGGERNPPYLATNVFTNDFAALTPDGPGVPVSDDSLLQVSGASGTCRVICFSPRHDWTLAEMPVDAIRGVVDVWAAQTEELGAQYRWVQIFENKGEVMGCSNPHPHGQIWAGDFLPNEPAKEDVRQREYFAAHRTPLLLDYLDRETQMDERVVLQNDDWVALVPFWAVWPFETLLLPRRRIARVPDLTDAERNSLADILKRLVTRYDNLFQNVVPLFNGLARRADRREW